MTVREYRRTLFLALFSFLSLFANGCESSNKNSASSPAVPPLHHAPAAAPSVPAAGARLMDGMGKVNFPITTSSQEAQAFFNQGVAQLYGFWFIEAEQS